MINTELAAQLLCWPDISKSDSESECITTSNKTKLTVELKHQIERPDSVLQSGQFVQLNNLTKVYPPSHPLSSASEQSLVDPKPHRKDQR